MGGAEPPMGGAEPPMGGAEPPAPPADPEVHPNTIPQAALFTCAEPRPSSSPARLRRIERDEYTAGASRSRTGRQPNRGRKDLDSVSHENPFSTPGYLPYSTYAADASVGTVTLGLFLNVIDDAAVPWAGAALVGAYPLRLFNADEDEMRNTCIFVEQAVSDECLERYLTLLLTRGVLHRRPTPAELGRLIAFARSRPSLEDDAQGEVGERRIDALRMVNSAARLMVGALFRSEMGAADSEDEFGRRHLSEDELRLAIGYLVSDTPPGSPGVSLDKNGAGPYTASETGHLEEIWTADFGGDVEPEIRRLIALYAAGVEPGRPDLAIHYDGERLPPRGKYWLGDKLTSFFRQWLDYTPALEIFKDTPAATSAFERPFTDRGGNAGRTARWILMSYRALMGSQQGVEADLPQQLDDLLARLVVETDADAQRKFVKELLSSRLAYVPSNATDSVTNQMHRVYNVFGDVDDAPDTEDTDGPRWLTLPDGERAGVLTHPAWLAAHGGNFEDDGSAIFRGKWIREQLLCFPPLSLDGLGGIQAQLIPRDDVHNARTRLEGSMAPECTSCHDMMNPLGYPFEMYNHAGFLRAPDHPRRPDTAVTLPMADSFTSTDVNDAYSELPREIGDAVEFSLALSESAHVERCFLRQTFRHFMGRDETLADACTLVAIEAAYAERGSFIDVLQALASSDAFLYRHDPVEE